MTLNFLNSKHKSIEDDIAENLIFKIGEEDSFYDDNIIRVSFESLTKTQLNKIKFLKNDAFRLKTFLSNILYKSVYFITGYYEIPNNGREVDFSFKFFIPFNSYSNNMYTSFGGPFHSSFSEKFYQPLIFPFEKYYVVSVLKLQSDIPYEFFHTHYHSLRFTFEHFDKNFPGLITKYHSSGIFPFITLPNLKFFPKEYLNLKILGYLSSPIKDKSVTIFSPEALPPYIEYSFFLKEIPEKDLERILNLENIVGKAGLIEYSNRIFS